MKKIFNLFTLTALVVFAGYLFIYATKPVKADVQIHFLNVGQGDATYIEISKGQNILIDGGPDSDAQKSLDKYLPFYDRKINHLVLTHPHLDHFGGLTGIVKNYDIRNLYMTKATNDTDEYKDFIRVVKNKNIPIHYVKKGDEIDFERDIKFKFLFPESENISAENINNSSIVSELDWGNKKALFMGDLEATEQIKIINSISKVDIFKVSHHCSTDAFAAGFYDKAKPDYAVISVGKGNSFGHPAKNCLDILNGSKVYRTDQDGEINFEMSKETIRVAN